MRIAVGLTLVILGTSACSSGRTIVQSSRGTPTTEAGGLPTTTSEGPTRTTSTTAATATSTSRATATTSTRVVPPSTRVITAAAPVSTAGSASTTTTIAAAVSVANQAPATTRPTPLPSKPCTGNDDQQAVMRDFFAAVNAGDMATLDQMVSWSHFQYASFPEPYGTNKADYSRAHSLEVLQAIHDGGVRVDLDTLRNGGTAYGQAGLIKVHDVDCGSHELAAFAWLRY
jgi:hypothetical protein